MTHLLYKKYPALKVLHAAAKEAEKSAKIMKTGGLYVQNFTLFIDHSLCTGAN